MTKKCDLGEEAVFNCCFMIRLYLTFSDTSAVWIYIVYFLTLS